MKKVKLYCTNCGKEYPSDDVFLRCDICNEPLEVELIKGKINKDVLDSSFKRYSEFMPFETIPEELFIGVGFTPLIKSTKIAADLGLQELYFKNEFQNPTWSFKDRGTATTVTHAVKIGKKKIGTVSSGNMAVSVAAHGMRAGLKTFILISSEIPKEKIDPIAIHGATVIKVKGDYGELYFKSVEVGKKNDIYFMNSDVPFRVEGYKTLSFEVVEQLKGLPPDFVIVPTSAGGHFRGIEKGFRELYHSGLIDRMPKMVCAQAAGCSPITDAYEKKLNKVERFKNPNTYAKAITNPFPPSGTAVLKILKANGGYAVKINENEILGIQKKLAAEGMFVQPASCVTIGAARKLKENGIIKPKDNVVCILTGAGLKYTKIFQEQNLSALDCNIDELTNSVLWE